MTTEEVFEAALHLDPSERERLAEQLMESLAAEKEFASEEIERAWLTEFERRSAELDAGTAELVDWSDVRSRIAARRASRENVRLRLVRAAEAEMFRAAVVTMSSAPAWVTSSWNRRTHIR